MYKLYKYNLQVLHDNGNFWITVYARSKKDAIDQVMKTEGCPKRAVINCNRA